MGGKEGGEKRGRESGWAEQKMKRGSSAGRGRAGELGFVAQAGCDVVVRAKVELMVEELRLASLLQERRLQATGVGDD